jgi:hypothetical protein
MAKKAGPDPRVDRRWWTATTRVDGALTVAPTPAGASSASRPVRTCTGRRRRSSRAIEEDRLGVHHGQPGDAQADHAVDARPARRGGDLHHRRAEDQHGGPSRAVLDPPQGDVVVLDHEGQAGEDDEA